MALLRETTSQSAPMDGEVLGITARTIRESLPASQDSSDTARPELVHLEAPGAYLKFFAETFRSAFLPDPRSPSNCSPKHGAWLRVCRQIKENPVGPSWANAT